MFQFLGLPIGGICSVVCVALAFGYSDTVGCETLLDPRCCWCPEFSAASASFSLPAMFVLYSFPRWVESRRRFAPVFEPICRLKFLTVG